MQTFTQNTLRFLEKNKHALIASVFVLINFLIKGLFLQNNSLGLDEPFSVYHAQMDVASIINLLSTGNNPPLYEIILHFWIKLFGISEFSVRFPSLIFSCITVLFIYKIGIKHLNNRVALYASIIFIFSNYHILFAHEARVYAFLGMLSTLSMYFYLEILDIGKSNLQKNAKISFSNNDKIKFITLLLLNVLLIYSHYFGFFILITQFLYLIFNKKLIIRYWKQILIGISIITILYIPNIIVIWSRFLDSSANGTWVKPPIGFESLYNMIWQFSNAPIVAVAVITVFAAAIVKYFIRKKFKPIKPYYSLMILWFIFILFFMFEISYIIPMFIGRYLITAAIAFSFVLAIAIDYIIEKPKLNYIIPGIICLLFIATVKPNITNKRNVEEVVNKVNEIKNPNTLVLISPQYFILNFAYYFDNEAFKNYNTLDIYSNIDSALMLENIYDINNTNNIDFKQWDHIVIVKASANPIFPNIENELNTNYSLINNYRIYEIFNVMEYKLK